MSITNDDPECCEENECNCADEPQVMDLGEAIEYYSQQPKEVQPVGYMMRFTFGERHVAPESHPLFEQMKLFAAGRDLHIQRRSLQFKEGVYTQYELVWRGSLKKMEESVTGTSSLIEDYCKAENLKPSMTFGFIGDKPQEEAEAIAHEDDIF
tara:strand:+ start:7836 stop:8294 length:459 start_codon:yes stop_codon:yes gene_type:complete